MAVEAGSKKKNSAPCLAKPWKAPDTKPASQPTALVVLQ
jgi:hypothetical protein